MGLFEIVIQKINMPDDAEPIGKNGKLVSIAEMTVNIQLLRILRRHEGVSHLIRVNIWFIFVIRLEPADERSESLGVVFGDIGFNAGCIKGEHLSEGRINSLADGFGKIDKLKEEIFNKRKKVLFEACKQRSVRNLLEAAELPEFPAEVQEKDQQEFGRNGKKLLKDKSSQKAGKGVYGPRNDKGTEKRIRNERIKVEMLIKKPKKRKEHHL
ncbi:hypothetical protein NE476_28325 [Enterocloster bolteae]|nr:hypothetical protein [Enterocloster bolteae]MCQ5146260.1 hypothetical protein [Enterocloster bolteae]